jgi:uncharacterized membrane protein YfcA
MTPITALFIALGFFVVYYLVNVVRGVRRLSRTNPSKPTAALIGTGFVTAFFDTLGIGSFATTTTIYRQFKLVDDEKIPGTLNIGHTLGTVAQAFIYTKLIPVEPRTLILMIVAAVLGAFLGAGIVGRWPRRWIQLGMGGALLAAALIMLGGLLKFLPSGGEAIALSGTTLVLGLAGNFLLGALMTLGIGLYAPCMILVSLLGMNSTAAFPIMMGSCAFLMPVASARFIRLERFDVRATLGLLIGSVPAVLLAAFIVKSLPLTAVRWLVVFVVVITAIGLLRAARREATAPAAPEAAPA